MGNEALVSTAEEDRRGGPRTLKVGFLSGLNEAMADEFEKIAKETISKAQNKCPPQDYVKGLRLIIEMLQKELVGKSEES